MSDKESYKNCFYSAQGELICKEKQKKVIEAFYEATTGPTKTEIPTNGGKVLRVKAGNCSSLTAPMGPLLGGDC